MLIGRSPHWDSSQLNLGFNPMKTKIAIAIGIASVAALPLMAGPVVTVQVPAPVVTVQVPPPPVVTVEVGVPDYYVWDGVEFVGVVGAQYYYLGPGNVWIVCDPVRLDRFHVWEKAHVDWRDHAVHNELYRHDAHGHEVPLRDDHSHDNAAGHNDSQSQSAGHDKGHGHDH